MYITLHKYPLKLYKVKYVRISFLGWMLQCFTLDALWSVTEDKVKEAWRVTNRAQRSFCLSSFTLHPHYLPSLRFLRLSNFLPSLSFSKGITYNLCPFVFHVLTDIHSFHFLSSHTFTFSGIPARCLGPSLVGVCLDFELRYFLREHNSVKVAVFCFLLICDRH